MEAKEGGGGRGRAPALESGARAGCPRPASTREAGRGGPSPRGGRGAVTGSAENSGGGGLQPGSGGRRPTRPEGTEGSRAKCRLVESTAWDADSRPEGVVLSVDKGRGKNTRKGSRETDRSPASKTNHVPSLKYFGKNELSQHAINGERSQGFNH